LTELGLPDAELSLLFVDDLQIRKLNRQYLHRDRSTNVLACPMKEGDFSFYSPELLGDLVISVDTAEREKGRFGLDRSKMTLLLMIHGILHLIGYDHEGTMKGAREMARKQMELLQKIVQKETGNFS
jgi:probable rRNA maturation factor